MNNVNLIGNLTRDPKAEKGQNGKTYCKFAVAVNYNDNNGEPRTDFIDCVCYGKQAELLETHCYKGRKVGVQGKLSSSDWQTQNGEKRHRLEVTAFRIEFLGEPKQKNRDIANQGAGFSDMNTDQYGRRPEQVKMDANDYGSAFYSTDDDLPF